MPVLRDIVARLGMDFDGRGFKKADQSIKGITGSLSNMALAAGAVAAAIGTFKVVGLASDVNETLNVLDAAFERNSQSVQQWAKDYGDSIGRSQFMLRDMAADLGAVLNPMMGRNADVAAEMSTTLSALAIDLGSFFNKADTDALRAMKAALVGEIEPMRRFGVVMHEAALDEFARSQGITKSLRSMNNIEKTQLRYNFLLKETAIAQGDALRTSEEYENTTKAIRGGLRDLATALGLALLPAFKRAAIWTRDLIRSFSDLVKNSEIVKAALIVLGSVATVVALKMLVAFAPIILKFILIGAAIAAVTLIVEDFLVFLSGGKSVIGEFINLIAGPGSAEEAALNLKMAWEGLTLYMNDQVLPAWQGLGAAIGWFIDDVSEGLKKFGQDILNFFDPVIKQFKAFADSLMYLGRMAGQFLGIDVDKLKKDFTDTFGDLKEKAQATFEFGAKEDYTGLTRAIVDTFDAEAAGLRKFRQERIPQQAKFPTKGAAQGGKGGAQLNQNITNNIQVAPGTPRQQAEALGQSASSGQQKQNRRALAAFQQKAE